MSTEKKYKTGSMRDRTEQPIAYVHTHQEKEEKEVTCVMRTTPRTKRKKQKKTTKNSFSFRLWAISPFAPLFLSLSSFSYFL